MRHSTPEPVEPRRCEACRRERYRGPLMERAQIEGVGVTLLCVDVVDCRLNRIEVQV